MVLKKPASGASAEVDDDDLEYELRQKTKHIARAFDDQQMVVESLSRGASGSGGLTVGEAAVLQVANPCTSAVISAPGTMVEEPPASSAFSGAEMSKIWRSTKFCTTCQQIKRDGRGHKHHTGHSIRNLNEDERKQVLEELQRRPRQQAAVVQARRVKT